MATKGIEQQSMDDKVKESVMVRGIASSILALSFPSVKNLEDLLRTHGYEIKKI